MNRLLSTILAFVYGAFLTAASAQAAPTVQSAPAQTDPPVAHAPRDTVVNIFFAHDRYGLGDESFKMDSLTHLLTGNGADFSITLYSYASNYGSKEYNRRLVDLRLLTVKHALMRRGVDESRIHPIVNNGIDRKSTPRFARRVEMVFTLPAEKAPADTTPADTAEADTAVAVVATPVDDTAVTATVVADSTATSAIVADSISQRGSPSTDDALTCPRLALRTNLLYDLAVVPNVGAEWFIDEHWSLAANVMYIWLKNDTHHRYWRLFSTDVEGRYWLKPQTCDVRTGHHFGLYAGFYRYDFEFGHRGYMGDANYGGGLSYGYALRLFPKWKERFTLDMSLGLGYLGGTHKEYIPDQGCYVWQRTMRHHLFIPTKAEVTLVWYPRCRFFNKKGGDK